MVTIFAEAIWEEVIPFNALRPNLAIENNYPYYNVFWRMSVFQFISFETIDGGIINWKEKIWH